MRKTKLQQLRMSKCENRMFSCNVYKLAEKAAELNALFADGWLTEETQVIGDTYVALLKKQSEGRKVFYVDVGSIAPNEIGPYMAKVKAILSDPSEEDFYIPSR